MRKTVLSSLLFLTNVFTTLYVQQYLYAALFMLLFMSSVLYRLLESEDILALDKVFVYSVVGYGAYVYAKKFRQLSPLAHALILGTFVSTIYIYHYGYQIKSLSFDPDPEIAEKFYAVLHFLSSVGHHCIILL